MRAKEEEGGGGEFRFRAVSAFFLRRGRQGRAEGESGATVRARRSDEKLASFTLKEMSVGCCLGESGDEIWSQAVTRGTNGMKDKDGRKEGRKEGRIPNLAFSACERAPKNP